LFTTLKIKLAVKKKDMMSSLLEAKKYRFRKFGNLGFISANII
jgi:hypothetical protein